MITMVDSEANDDKEQTLEERWQEMYASHMGMHPDEAMGPPRNRDEDKDDEKESQDEEDDVSEQESEETICAECGEGSNAYPDDALDQFTLNYDEETVHYGCK